MKVLAAAFIASSFAYGSVASAGSSAPPDPEAMLELDFTDWAQANGVPFDRLSCDVTVGEGDVCFIIAGPVVAAYIPSVERTGWSEYGPTPTPVASTTLPPVQPLLAQSDIYYANCSEARDAGDTPLYEDDPGYRPGLDRDSDGVACE
ncbi:hypothetical protein BH24ACT5_BH24ACT5_21380 [soil metagenome]